MSNLKITSLMLMNSNEFTIIEFKMFFLICSIIVIVIITSIWIIIRLIKGLKKLEEDKPIGINQY